MDIAVDKPLITPPMVFAKKRPLSLYSEVFGSANTARSTRCSVVAAHPNDEIVGGGCLLSKLSNVRILHLSDGAPRSIEEATAAGFDSVEAYASARRRECREALAIAKVPADRVVELNRPQMALSLDLPKLTYDVLGFLQKTAPRVVLTHAYEGGHPDHDATAFATHCAIKLMRKNGIKPPVIFEMALYPGNCGRTKVPEFLHNPARESTTIVLDRRAQELKRQMFDCFESQKSSLTQSPLGPEKFRKAPTYQFLAPPHNGQLHYEKFDWGITGADWRKLAKDALADLFG